MVGVQFTGLDTDIIDIPYYNHLLKSVSFWDQMGAVDKVLLFQVCVLATPVSGLTVLMGEAISHMFDCWAANSNKQATFVA